MMGFILWIILGALAGWIASLIMGKDSRMNWLANIIVGIVGAALGGWIASLIGLGTVATFSLGGLLIAIAGACLLLLIGGWISKAMK